MSGAGGCGVIVGRLPDGSWSPPSGIMLHTAGLGFMVGIDIYDCVLVINTDKAMEAFSRIRCTVGGELSAVAGPVGTGFVVESEIHARQAPIYTYMKSRGFYAGVQVDGTIMLERDEENERFYMEKLRAKEILSGKVRHPPYELKSFFATLKAAEGDQNVDQSLVPSEPPPGDYEIDHDASPHFGVPDKDDPDPYGVLQLEKEGMVIREAGTQKRASWEQFTFAPAVTSPVYDTFERKSKDRDVRSRLSTRNSWTSIGSTLASGSAATRDRATTQSSMTDMATQTDDLPPPPSPGLSSRRSSNLMSHNPSMENIPEDKIAPPSPLAGSFSPRVARRISQKSTLSRTTTPPKDQPEEHLEEATESLHINGNAENPADDGAEDDSDDDDEHDDLDHSAIIEEAPVMQSIYKPAVPQVIQKARMVSVPKRGPPPILPPRNPNRSRGPLVINADRNDGDSDAGSIMSPGSQAEEFDRAETPTSPPTTHVDHPTEYQALEETPEEHRHDPWAKVMKQHENPSQDSLDVPGAFHSMPTTPDEQPSQPNHTNHRDDVEDFS